MLNKDISIFIVNLLDANIPICIKYVVLNTIWIRLHKTTDVRYKTDIGKEWEYLATCRGVRV